MGQVKKEEKKKKDPMDDFRSTLDKFLKLIEGGDIEEAENILIEAEGLSEKILDDNPGLNDEIQSDLKKANEELREAIDRAGGGLEEDE